MARPKGFPSKPRYDVGAQVLVKMPGVVGTVMQVDYCTRQGLLSRFEREILLRFKVDGFTHKEIQNRHTVLTDQAVRLRVHRIMQRLQETALSLSTRTDRANHGSRQITPVPLKKNEEGMKHFSLKHSPDFLPISKSRGQPLSETLEFWREPARVVSVFSIILGVLALLLASLGIYGTPC